jgi:hypothetical protein
MRNHHGINFPFLPNEAQCFVMRKLLVERKPSAVQTSRVREISEIGRLTKMDLMDIGGWGIIVWNYVMVKMKMFRNKQGE